MVQTRRARGMGQFVHFPPPAGGGGGDSVATAQVEERQLLKAMSWWDGFVVALANPGFLIAALGSSIGALGTTGAFVLWTISICLGALQNNIHAEMACMFPNKSGGVALYAHEAWRKYLTFIGPVATFGYWIGWSVVLSVNGLVAGTLVQAEFFSSTTWTASGAGFDLSLPILIGVALIVLVWLFNVYGVRPAVWFGYVTGALLCIPAFVLMFLPYVTGDWSSSNMTWSIGSGGGLALILTWLYFMCWSSYGIEVVATFAPEFHDTEKDTPKALRSAALFSALVYALLPLGLGGLLVAVNVAFLVCGGFLFSGGFLGITGYGYGWDKTRTGLIVLVVAFLLYVYRHVVQDKIPVKLREQVPATPEEERRHPDWKAVPDAVAST